MQKKIIEHFYGCWSLKSGKVQWRKVLAMKIISLESLLSVLWKRVSNLFEPKYAWRVCKVGIAKYWLKPFSLYLFTLQSRHILLKIIHEKDYLINLILRTWFLCDSDNGSILQFLKEGKLYYKLNLPQLYYIYCRRCTIEKWFYSKLNKKKGLNERNFSFLWNYNTVWMKCSICIC